MTKKKPESEKLKVGRPAIYTDVKELQKIIDKYFEETPENRYSVTGLALYLGFSDKSTVYDYSNKPEFSHPIKRALTKIEMMHEIGLSGNNTAGHIFALKNSGWKDKIEQEITSNALQVVVADTETKNKIDTLFKDANNG